MSSMFRGVRRAARVAVATAAVAAVIGGSDVAFAAVDYLSGGGAQPEDVLPASVVAIAKVDFDPSLDQKLAVYQLSKKLPVDGSSTFKEDTLKDDLLGSLFAEFGENYARDFKPWIGDRAAVAYVPDMKDESGFAMVAAVQYKDRGKANVAMNRLRAAAARHPEDTQLNYALKGGYVLIAETPAKVRALAAATTYLSADPGYTESLAALGGDQVATAWVDIRATYVATPRAERKSNPYFSGLTSIPTGHYVAGVHADPSYLEVRGMAIGTNAETNKALFGGLGATPGANLLSNYPSDTWAAFDAVGFGDMLAKFYGEVGDDDAELERGMRLKLPEDIKTILGEETAVGVFGTTPGKFDIAARVRSTTPSKAHTAAQKVLGWYNRESGGPRVDVRKQMKLVSNGYLMGTSPAAVAKLASGAKPLGQTASFQKAVPDADGAGITVFVNIQAGLRQLQVFERGDPEAKRYRYLDSFGFTMSPATGSFRARLTVT